MTLQRNDSHPLIIKLDTDRMEEMAYLTEVTLEHSFYCMEFLIRTFLLTTRVHVRSKVAGLITSMFLKAIE